MLSKHGSEVKSPNYGSDYSFRPSGTLPDEEVTQVDEAVARVENEKAEVQKKDLTRNPAAAEFCKTSLELTTANNSRYELAVLNHRLRERGLELPAAAAELFSATSPLFSESPQTPKTPVGKFMFALRKAGMVDGLDWEQPDYEVAINVMNELRNEDPDNAAPAIFQLLIEQRRGTSLEDLGELVQEVANARKFDTFYTRAMKEFREAVIALQDPTSFMLSAQILSTMPIPTYNALTSLVNTLSESQPDLKENLAEVMTRPGREAAESHDIYGYNVLDYSYGRAFSERDLPRFNEIELLKAQPPIRLDQMAFDMQECSDQTYNQYLSNLATLKSALGKY